MPVALFRRVPRRIWLAIAVVLLLASPWIYAAYCWSSARSSLVAHQPIAARHYLKRVAWWWADTPAYQVMLCRAAWQSDDIPAALDAVHMAQRLGGTTDATTQEWAYVQAAAGNTREVEEFLQKAVYQSPETANLVWESLTLGYNRTYRTLDAMAVVKQWLKSDEENLRALELRGQIYVAGKGVKRGTDDFREVLLRDPTRDDTRRRLIGCLIDLGGYQEAIPHLEYARRHSHPDPDLLARLARCYNMVGRTAESRTVLDEVLREHPTNFLAVRTRGQFSLLEQQPDYSEALLTKAIIAAPDDYQSHFLLTQALQQQGKLDAAKQQAKLSEDVKDRGERMSELTSRKLAEFPLDPALHTEMGELLLQSGQPTIAQQWLESALALAPNHAPAHALLAKLYRTTNQHTLAEQHDAMSKPTTPP